MSATTMKSSLVVKEQICPSIFLLINAEEFSASGWNFLFLLSIIIFSEIFSILLHNLLSPFYRCLSNYLVFALSDSITHLSKNSTSERVKSKTFFLSKN